MVSILRPDEINARSEASEWHTPSDQPLSDHSQPVPPEDQSQAGGGGAEARQQSHTRPRHVRAYILQRKFKIHKRVAGEHSDGRGLGSNLELRRSVQSKLYHQHIKLLFSQ